MCRLAAFPPRFPRLDALKILADMEDKNTDGVGCAFIRDGQFVVQKWPKSFSWAMKKGKPFLGHMPYNDSWTIAHLRAASHGCNCDVNTHPFIVGDWCVAHNGIWSEYNIAKLTLSKTVNFEGDTDSEVAAHLINIVGPKRFAEEIEYGGVFLALNRNGDLHVAKTSGDLCLSRLKDEQILLSSELHWQQRKNAVEALLGWYQFNKKGFYVKHKEKKFEMVDNYYDTPISYGAKPSAGMGKGTSFHTAYGTFHEYD